MRGRCCLWLGSDQSGKLPAVPVPARAGTGTLRGVISRSSTAEAGGALPSLRPPALPSSSCGGSLPRGGEWDPLWLPSAGQRPGQPGSVLTFGLRCAASPLPYSCPRPWAGEGCRAGESRNADPPSSGLSSLPSSPDPHPPGHRKILFRLRFPFPSWEICAASLPSPKARGPWVTHLPTFCWCPPLWDTILLSSVTLGWPGSPALEATPSPTPRALDTSHVPWSSLPSSRPLCPAAFQRAPLPTPVPLPASSSCCAGRSPKRLLPGPRSLSTK